VELTQVDMQFLAKEVTGFPDNAILIDDRNDPIEPK
jgi:hypothetical protein